MPVFVRSGGVYQPVGFNGLLFRSGGVYNRWTQAYVKDAGAYKSVWRADTPPPPPISLAAGLENGGNIYVNWDYQPNYEYDYATVEVQEPGDLWRFPTAFPATTQHRGGYAHGQLVALEVRTKDSGGNVSAWVPVPGTADVPPSGGGPWYKGQQAISAKPGQPVITSLYWGYTAAYGTTLHATWNNPANTYGDIHTQQLWVRRQGEAEYFLRYVGAFSEGAQGPWLAWYGGYDVLYSAYVRLHGAAGYTDSPVVQCWTPPQPGTEKQIIPHEGDSFAYDASWRLDGLVREGHNDGLGLHYGMFFYQNQLVDACHGYPPVSGDITMIRNGSQGTPGNLYFYCHNYGWRPSGTPVGNGVGWNSSFNYAAPGASATEPIPTNVLATIANGTTRGIGLWSGSPPKVMLGPMHNGAAGVVKLRW